jgi:hypothetical protein
MAKLNAQSKVILQAKRQKKFMKNAPISLLSSVTAISASPTANAGRIVHRRDTRNCFEKCGT